MVTGRAFSAGRVGAHLSSDPSLLAALAPTRPAGELEEIGVTGHTVIIPAFNEEARIAKTLERYTDYFDGWNWEILVEMDGCTDRTSEIVDRIAYERPNIRALHFKKRKGKGGGILEAVKVAKGEIAVFADADGCVAPAMVAQLARVIEREDADGAIGSRYSRGSLLPKKQGLPRRLASAGFRVLVRALFDLPYSDTQCGAKAFRREALLSILGEMKLADYAFDVELLWRLYRGGFRIVEVPVVWNHEDGSKLELPQVVPAMFNSLFWLRLYGLNGARLHPSRGSQGNARFWNR